MPRTGTAEGMAGPGDSRDESVDTEVRDVVKPRPVGRGFGTRRAAPATRP